MSLSYTTGNPSNLTAGATASMNDIAGPFADVKTFLTDSSAAVNDTILASPTNAVWRTVFSFSGGIQTLTTTPSYFGTVGPLNVASGVSSSAAAGAWIPPASADVAVAGKTTRLRSRVIWLTNSPAPGITLTWGLYPVTGLGVAVTSAVQPTLGTVIAGSTAAVVTPGATTADDVAGASFDFSLVNPANLHLPGVVGSGSQAANSFVYFQYILEMRHT